MIIQHAKTGNLFDYLRIKGSKVEQRNLNTVDF